MRRSVDPIGDNSDNLIVSVESILNDIKDGSLTITKKKKHNKRSKTDYSPSFVNLELEDTQFNLNSQIETFFAKESSFDDDGSRSYLEFSKALGSLNINCTNVLLKEYMAIQRIIQDDLDVMMKEASKIPQVNDGPFANVDDIFADGQTDKYSKIMTNVDMKSLKLFEDRLKPPTISSILSPDSVITSEEPVNNLFNLHVSLHHLVKHCDLLLDAIVDIPIHFPNINQNSDDNEEKASIADTYLKENNLESEVFTSHLRYNSMNTLFSEIIETTDHSCKEEITETYPDSHTRFSIFRTLRPFAKRNNNIVSNYYPAQTSYPLDNDITCFFDRYGLSSSNSSFFPNYEWLANNGKPRYPKNLEDNKPSFNQFIVGGHSSSHMFEMLLLNSILAPHLAKYSEAEVSHFFSTVLAFSTSGKFSSRWIKMIPYFYQGYQYAKKYNTHSLYSAISKSSITQGEQFVSYMMLNPRPSISTSHIHPFTLEGITKKIKGLLHKNNHHLPIDPLYNQLYFTEFHSFTLNVLHNAYHNFNYLNTWFYQNQDYFKLMKVDRNIVSFFMATSYIERRILLQSNKFYYSPNSDMSLITPTLTYLNDILTNRYCAEFPNEMSIHFSPSEVSKLAASVSNVPSISTYKLYLLTLEAVNINGALDNFIVYAPAGFINSILLHDNRYILDMYLRQLKAVSTALLRTSSKPSSLILFNSTTLNNRQVKNDAYSKFIIMWEYLYISLMATRHHKISSLVDGLVHYKIIDLSDVTSHFKLDKIKSNVAISSRAGLLNTFSMIPAQSGYQIYETIRQYVSGVASIDGNYRPNYAYARHILENNHIDLVADTQLLSIYAQRKFAYHSPQCGWILPDSHAHKYVYPVNEAPSVLNLYFGSTLLKPEANQFVLPPLPPNRSVYPDYPVREKVLELDTSEEKILESKHIIYIDNDESCEDAFQILKTLLPPVQKYHPHALVEAMYERDYPVDAAYSLQLREHFKSTYPKLIKKSILLQPDSKTPEVSIASFMNECLQCETLSDFPIPNLELVSDTIEEHEIPKSLEEIFPLVVGFDVEATPGLSSDINRPVQLIQISVKDYIFILDVQNWSTKMDFLLSLITAHPNVLKVGVSVVDDKKYLQNYFKNNTVSMKYASNFISVDDIVRFQPFLSKHYSKNVSYHGASSSLCPALPVDLLDAFDGHAIYRMPLSPVSNVAEAVSSEKVAEIMCELATDVTWYNVKVPDHKNAIVFNYPFNVEYTDMETTIKNIVSIQGMFPNILSAKCYIKSRLPPIQGGNLGMRYLASEYLGRSINKDQQVSDWSRRPLNANQMKYAALDANLSGDLFTSIAKKSNPEAFFKAFRYLFKASLKR